MARDNKDPPRVGSSPAVEVSVLLFLSVLLLSGCEAGGVIDSGEPEPAPLSMVTLTVDCAAAPDYALFELGEGEAVSAWLCEADTDRCVGHFHDRLEDGTVRIYCEGQYEYARVVAIYP